MTKIPEEIKSSLKRYVDNKIPTGSFLQSVLENNLMNAVAKADYHNSKIISEICHYIYNTLPSNCYGSPEIVKEWLRGRK